MYNAQAPTQFEEDNDYFWSFFLFDNMIVWVYADIAVYMTYVSYRFNMLDTHDQSNDHVN